METAVYIVVGILAVVAIAATLYVLNRSWGDFGRAGQLPPTGASAPGESKSPAQADQAAKSWGLPERLTTGTEAAGESALPARAEPVADSWGLPERLTTGTEAPSAAPAGEAGVLVPIAHPLVRRSAEQALQRGSSAARYIVRQGDQLYFDFSAIEDPARRQRAYDLMRRFNAGQDVDIGEMVRLVRELFQP